MDANDIRTLVLDRLNNTKRYIDMSRENNNINSVLYFSGMYDGIMEILQNIDWRIEKEVEDMLKCQKPIGTQKN